MSNTCFSVAPSQGRKALVVDDVDVNRAVVKGALKKLGYAVVEAENGVTALDLFQQDPPDLVLMDVMMPVMDGLEATRRIKAACGDRWVPVLIMSALGSDDDIVAGIEAGADDYLPKPVKLQILRAKIGAIERTLSLKNHLREALAEAQRLLAITQEENSLAREIIRGQLERQAVDPSSRVQYRLRAADQFSGDLVASALAPDGRLYCMLADATGHGLSAAMCMMPIASIFYGMATKGLPLSELIAESNRQLRSLLPVGYFVSAAFVCVDYAARSLELWTGGVPDLLWLDAAGRVARRYPSTQLALGVWDGGPGSFDTHRITWDEPGQLMMYSDGLIEAVDAQGIAFGDERLQTALAGGTHDSRLTGVEDAWQVHLGDTVPTDDMSLALVTLP